MTISRWQDDGNSKICSYYYIHHCGSQSFHSPCTIFTQTLIGVLEPVISATQFSLGQSICHLNERQHTLSITCHHRLYCTTTCVVEGWVVSFVWKIMSGKTLWVRCVVAELYMQFLCQEGQKYVQTNHIAHLAASSSDQLQRLSMNWPKSEVTITILFNLAAGTEISAPGTGDRNMQNSYPEPPSSSDSPEIPGPRSTIPYWHVFIIETCFSGTSYHSPLMMTKSQTWTISLHITIGYVGNQLLLFIGRYRCAALGCSRIGSFGFSASLLYLS